MKTLYNFIAIVITAGIFIYSCGDDNTVNNNNNGNPSANETLRVTHDSLAVYSRTSNSQFNFVFGCTSQYSRYHITFSVETNVDTCCPYDSSYLKVQSFIIYPNAHNFVVHVNKTRGQIPGTNVNAYFNMIDTTGYSEAGHHFDFGFSDLYPPGKYIRIKNLRVYTVH